MPNDEARMTNQSLNRNAFRHWGLGAFLVIRTSSLGIQTGTTGAGLWVEAVIPPNDSL
jgi:hypothetical protein